MNYSETVQYLYSRLPMFSKLGASAIKSNLTNTIELCSRLGDPHKKFESIHVGGTNGKGSTSHMLSAILQIAGYKTGLYTSPHLRDFRERIRINGEMMPETAVVEFVQKQRKSIEELSPSFFEVTVAMAFDYFAREQVDIAVIEVGLGGRLDSTNVISPILSVITNIGYDHMNILGDTLPQIASEKAGIIKPHIPVVIGEKQQEVEDIFITAANRCKSEIVFASEEWDVRPDSRLQKAATLNLIATHSFQHTTYALELDLWGSYQMKNIKAVLSAVQHLQNIGYIITSNHIQTALKQVTSLTGLMGRWQILNREPLTICDTGHNEDGILEVLKNINATEYQDLHMIIGMVKDKDVHKILSMLPTNAHYYFCQPALERAVPASELLKSAEKFGLEGRSYPTVKEALDAAKKNAGLNDLIFIGGSTFVVAEII
jgi:dihydrofolate synthase / folylpolyglutamate synthase